MDTNEHAFANQLDDGGCTAKFANRLARSGESLQNIEFIFKKCTRLENRFERPRWRRIANSRCPAILALQKNRSNSPAASSFLRGTSRPRDPRRIPQGEKATALSRRLSVRAASNRTDRCPHPSRWRPRRVCVNQSPTLFRSLARRDRVAARRRPRHSVRLR